jgi:hypothetical protein
MKSKWTNILVLVGLAAGLSNLFSCAHSQQLVAIQIQPSVETIGASNIPVSDDAGQQVQLRALGSYIHPPVTKDITNEVTWASNDTQMFTVNATGMLTATGNACGGTLVSATSTTNTSTGGISSSGAIVTGYMTGNVTCFTGTGTGTGPAITVTFANSNTGNVTFSPSGIICSSPSPCVEEFSDGTAITLTATPTGSSQSASWTGCPITTNTNVCTFTLETNTTVTVTFM